MRTRDHSTRAPRPAVLARTLLIGAIALLATLWQVGPAEAQPVPSSERVERVEPMPKRLEGVDVVEHLGAAVPLDLGFTDETGKPVLLREYFDGRVPVILTLNYSRCPMLCSLQLNGFTRSLSQLGLDVGKDFRVVTVSIDPEEKPATSLRTKQRFLAEYGRRPTADGGWHFLTGSPGNVRALADAVGFHYAYNEARDEYVHPAAITILMPDGKISRYLYGIEYPTRTLHLSLVEASEGRIGTSVDRFVLFCFHYDEKEGRYAPFARNIMRLGGGLAVLAVGGLLGAFWLNELRKRRRGSA